MSQHDKELEKIKKLEDELAKIKGTDTKLEEIRKLEAVLQRYQNNYDFAVKNNNPVRQSKYRTLILNLKQQIKDIEIAHPLESNIRLREIIDDLRKAMEELKKKNNNLQKQLDEQKKKIDNILNPPKPEPEPEPEANYVCPACGRGGFKGVKGVKAHQASGACGRSRKPAVNS